MEWFVNNIGSIIILIVLIAIVVAIIFYFIRKKKKGQGTCSCDCGSCAMHGTCHDNNPKVGNNKDNEPSTQSQTKDNE